MANSIDPNEIDRLEKKYKESCHPISQIFMIEGQKIEDVTLEECNELIKKKPESVSYFIRGLVHASAQNYQSAIEDYNVAIKLDPRTNAYDHKVRACFRVGKANDIADSLDELILSKIDLLAENKNSEDSIEFYEDQFSNAFEILFDLLIVLEQYNTAKDLIIKCFPYFKKKHFADFVTRFGETREKEKGLSRDLKIERQKNENLVQRYSHTLANTIFPRTLSRIVEQIKGYIELKKETVLLERAYHAERIIIIENELLQKRYSTSNNESFRQAIRSENLDFDYKNTLKINNVLECSLGQVFARILNQNNSKTEAVRTKLLNKTGLDLLCLRKSYEESLIFAEPPKLATEWSRIVFFPVEVRILSPAWENVRIREEGFVEALFYGHFTELFFNAFKYSTHESDYFLRIIFDEWDDAGEKYLTVTWTNPVEANKIIGLSAGKGLEAIREDLQQLNDCAVTKHTLTYETSESIFSVRLSYLADLLIPPSLPDIDLSDLF